jgi:LCP family protein required for cell wall assembly
MGLRFLVAGALIVVLAAAATATAGLEKVNNVAHEIFRPDHQIKAPKGVFSPIYSGQPETFLILGSDKRILSKDQFDLNDPPHSDTILLVRFDPSQGQTSIVSIPRDLLVPGGITVNGENFPVEKINAAYTLGAEYLHGTDGGAALAAETVKKVLGIKSLNGVIDITFTGFIRVVGALGCVYVNVDRRYYIPPNTGTSPIDLQPGYQKLCYDSALAYVRYRHTDSDFVRVARQQDFLRDLREQFGSSLLGRLDQISKYVGDAIATNIGPSVSNTITLGKLLVFSQQKPLRQVKFRYATDNTEIDGGSYVTATPTQIAATMQDFLYGDQHTTLPTFSVSTQASSSGHAAHSGAHTKAKAAVSPAAIGLYPTPTADEDEAVTAATSVPFPVLYPKLQTGPAVQQDVRAYAVRDRQGRLHHAFIEVFEQNSQGGYYDVEGTDWTDPPIIDHGIQKKIDGRNYTLIEDGSHIHLIAWHHDGILYWVNNTLEEDLHNDQLIGIARSVKPLN